VTRGRRSGGKPLGERGASLALEGAASAGDAGDGPGRDGDPAEGVALALQVQDPDHVVVDLDEEERPNRGDPARIVELGGGIGPAVAERARPPLVSGQVLPAALRKRSRPLALSEITAPPVGP